MRNLKFIHIMVLNIAAIVATSCGDMLDLAPIDNYGSTSYWKTESQVSAYIDGLHKQLRDMAEQHIITFGELRSDIIRMAQVQMVWLSLVGKSVYKICLRRLPELPSLEIFMAV